MGHDPVTVNPRTTLASLRAELTRLSARVAALEAAAAQAPAATGTAPAAAAPEPFPEELLPVLVAAAAAYLGVKPVIRQIRLADSAAWSQAGRTRLQASHALPPTTRPGARP